MKTGRLKLIAMTFLFVLQAAQAFGFSSGSTGALGAFNPTSNTTVQLPPDGILNYTTVNIPSGVTVTFAKNATNTPVYMLATGNITIAGTIDVSGSAAYLMTPGKGGPGGYDGGYGGLFGTYGASGQGPNSGAAVASLSNCGGGGGSINTNERIIPTVGGSGGGGGCSGIYGGNGGGGGGGAGGILIASSGKVMINGSITANGGGGGQGGYSHGSGGGGGAGGTIKIIADEIAGNGTVSTTSGYGGSTSYGAGGAAGATGKIRFEFNKITRDYPTSPAYTFDMPGQVFYTTTFPVLSIVSVGGITVPASPKADYNETDIVLPHGSANPISIVVSAANIPAGTTVTVKALPQHSTAGTASGTAALSGTDDASSATVALTLSTTRPSIIVASATFNITVASNGAQLYAEEEKVVKMRVDTELNGPSLVTYITETGREVLAMNLR